ncbi:MAG: hypothetical protein IJ646_08640 [Clostridia bacterium]|nr:hypothetical protein [Clostridia bacterium]
MTDGQKVILIALGVLLALCVVVSATLNHHIGGFIETVAREEEERQAAEEAARDADTGE